MTLNNDEEFRFIFEDNSELLVPKNQIIEISPTFYFKNINNNEQNVIKMPAFVKHDDLDNFINIFQKYISRLRQFNFDESFISIKVLLEGNSIKITKLIELSELFENNSFSIILIKDCILSEKKENEDIDENHTMNMNNVIILLHLSYNKLKEINNKDKPIILTSSQENNNIEAELEATWLDLFIKSLEMIGNNLNYYFAKDIGDNVTNNKLWSFDKKIIDELYEKFALNLITNNYIINENEKEIDLNDYSDIKQNKIDLKELNKIIDFLIKKRNQSDFFSLLSNEFMRIISEENINEINSLPNPTFILKININDIYSYYEEYPINNSFNINDTTKLIIVVYYKKNDDSFNVSLKLSKDKSDKSMPNFDIMTFLSLALVEEINNRQINVKSLTNNKSMYEIMKINNFSKLISKSDKVSNSSGNEYFTLKLFLKPCFLYTMLCNYLFHNIENLYTNKNICKLSKNLLSIIIRKKQLLKNEENDSHKEDSQLNNVDKIVMCLINWLNDEVNVGEDISEIIKNIKWDKVSLPLIFEFLIKYAIHIISDDIEYIFTNSLAKILKHFELDLSILSKEIIHSLLLSSKKMNYISMFCENKKMKKFNLYEIMNKRRNISIQNDKKNENNASSLANSINNKNEISAFSNNQNSTKDGHEIKKIGTRQKNKIKIGIDNSSIETKYLSKNKNNISFINKNSDIYYNNYFTNCHNNFNINIYKANKSNNDKMKKNFSQINKKKVIISQIKIRKDNNTKYEIYKKNNIKINNRAITSSNKKNISNSPDSYSPEIKERLNKIASNNILNKTINYKNLNNNLDRKLIKDKCDRNKSKKINKNKFNSSDIKNKTFIITGHTYLNYKKNYQEKNVNEYLGKASNKKEKNKTQISLLNELLNFNKKGKKENNTAIKINQSVNIKKQNLTQIHFDKK